MSDAFTLGYIVVSGAGDLFSLGNYHDGPKAGLLLLAGLDGENVTLFPTRATARRAIARTMSYADRHQLQWAIASARVISATRALASYKP